jgi:hypothetical protein
LPKSFYRLFGLVSVCFDLRESDKKIYAEHRIFFDWH